MDNEKVPVYAIVQSIVGWYPNRSVSLPHCVIMFYAFFLHKRFILIKCTQGIYTWTREGHDAAASSSVGTLIKGNLLF